jgi:hypothetical protein
MRMWPTCTACQQTDNLVYESHCSGSGNSAHGAALDAPLTDNVAALLASGTEVPGDRPLLPSHPGRSASVGLPATSVDWRLAPHPPRCAARCSAHAYPRLSAFASLSMADSGHDAQAGRPRRRTDRVHARPGAPPGGGVHEQAARERLERIEQTLQRLPELLTRPLNTLTQGALQQ